MNLRTHLLLIFLIFFSNAFAQEPQVNVFQRNLAIDYRLRDFVTDIKLSKVVDNYGEKYIGSFFLFDNWENNSVVKLNGKDFRLNNVNFNVQSNDFMSEVGKDSVFTVIPKYIDFITINGSKYKYRLFKGDYKFFEVLFDSEKNFSLFKGFFIKVIPKSELGMLNRPYDEIRKEDKLYVLKRDKLILLKRKKKEVLKFFIEENTRNQLLKFVKDNKLSFKNEKDLIEIFKYYDKI